MIGRRLLSCVLAGILLGLLEAMVVTVADYSMFLSYRELGRLLASTLATGVVGVLVLGLPWSMLAVVWPRVADRGYLWTGLAGFPAFAWAAWLLTSGRRVAELPLRSVGVVLLGLLAAALVGVAIRLVDARLRAASRLRWLFPILLGAIVVVLAIDSLVLRRLYPAFHMAFAGLAGLVGVQLARLLAARVEGANRPLVAAAIAAALLSPVGWWALLDSPTARFAVERCAPLTGKLVSRLPRATPPAVALVADRGAPAATAGLRAGIDLAGSDVLLITVDALRADVLRAYGGNGLTPQIDRLADQSAVFLRAYTPTPHTSYAVTSLLTGKYMRGVMALSSGSSGHVTLAQILRRYGYRTAGFYPPAIFFVDRGRFDDMRRQHLGFEYAKEMFATAEHRVQQLDAYLREVEPGHPLFVWVHLFEPHEPYEPPEGFARDDSPRGRYDGEVAAVDVAVGALVARFRAARPGATVILTADHGEEFGDHGGYHHGTTLFDEQIRVPLLWSSPGVVEPRMLELPVDTVDLVTTLLAALGIPPDARMRGDDLTPELAGAKPDPARRAFAAIDDARMVTDGRYKAVCHHGGHCQLFDLVSDPRELRDISGQQPERVAGFRADLSSFVASIPRLEGLALARGSGWHDALARARLGDATVAPQLLPLLGAEDPAVRAAAAAGCGDLAVAGARTVLARLRDNDDAPEVRAAAAIAGLQLGDDDSLASVVTLVGPDRLAAGVEQRRSAHRAALALAGRNDARATAALIDMAADADLDELQRRKAIGALGRLRAVDAEPALVVIMDEVRLRPDATRALGRIGGESAANIIAERFASERYPESRRAQADALVAMGDARARALIERFLGTATSVPDGVAQLLKLGTLGRTTRCGGDLRADRSSVIGAWQCSATGCSPGSDAQLELPGRAVARRLVMRVLAADASAQIVIDGRTYRLRPGPQEVTATLPAGVAQVRVAGTAIVEAFACVPVREDIAPPAAVPWRADAGTGEAG